MLASLVSGARRCRKKLPIRPILPVISCFPDLESRNFNRLVLIPRRVARAIYAGVSPWGAPATRGAVPRGIPNPRRRVPNLVARPLRAKALADLIDRKPHLLRPLAAQQLPPPHASINPAIGPSSLRTVEDVRQMLSAGLAAAARGESSPAEAASIARRACARLRAVRRSHT
jgi:hypothetical protein